MIDTSKKYTAKAKRSDTGKYWSFGWLKWFQYNPDKEGYISLSFRKTPEFIQLYKSTPDNGYINFIVYEDTPREQTPHNAAKANAYAPDELEDDIPY